MARTRGMGQRSAKTNANAMAMIVAVTIMSSQPSTLALLRSHRQRRRTPATVEHQIHTLVIH